MSIRHVKPPAKTKVSVRARKYVSNKLSGMSDYQAAVSAGYSHNTAIAAKQNIENPSVQILIQELMDKRGISDDYLLNKLQDGLDNSTRIFGTGDNIVEVADYGVRHKYLETALRLKDLYPSSTVATAIDLRTVIFNAGKYVE